jgi:hypothetical protein
MMRRSLIALAVMASLALPSTALGASSTAVGRGVTAKLSWSGTFGQEHGLALRISAGGSVLYSKPIASAACGSYCDVATYGTHAPVHVVSLSGSSAPPSVLVDLYTGGAHCCSVAQVFSESSTGSWSVVEHDFGDPGYRIATEGTGANATKVFISADDSFAYAFTDYADSGLPIQILSLRNGQFVDVTSQYRSLIKIDAARWLSAYRQMGPKYVDTVGILAPWVADEARLGNASLAFSYLRRQVALHRVNTGPFPVTKGGSEYVTRLRAFLVKHGYLK